MFLSFVREIVGEIVGEVLWKTVTVGVSACDTRGYICGHADVVPREQALPEQLCERGVNVELVPARSAHPLKLRCSAAVGSVSLSIFRILRNGFAHASGRHAVTSV